MCHETCNQPPHLRSNKEQESLPNFYKKDEFFTQFNLWFVTVLLLCSEFQAVKAQWFLLLQQNLTCMTV